MTEVGLPPSAGRHPVERERIASHAGACARLLAASLLLLGFFATVMVAPVPAFAQQSTIEGLGNVPVWVPPTREGELPSIEVPAARSTVPPGSDEMFLTPTRIDVVGATALSERRLNQITQGFIGREVALSELYGLAARIQIEYRNRGYLLSRALVPAQRIENGVFRIEVIEGFFEDVFVVGEIGPAKWQVEQYVNNLLHLRPVRTQDIERYLLLSNDLPGIDAVAVIRPGTSGPGAAQLVVEVERDPFDGFVSVNNRGSHFAGPWAGAFGVAANGFAPYGERTEFVYYRALDTRDPVYNNAGDLIVDELPMEQWYGQISHEAHLFDEGMSLLLSATQTLSHPGYTLAPLDLKTRVDAYSAELRYPIVRSRARTIEAYAGFTHSMHRSSALGEPIGNDRMSVVEVGASIDFEDVLPRWLLPFDILGSAQSHLDLSVRRGLPLFGATPDESNVKSRLEGTSQFTSLQARFERAQGILNRFELYLASKAQYSFDTLLSSEEFRLGGDEFGRGYNPSEIAGEHGVGATVEFRYADRPSWWALEAYEAYAFYDYGIVWNEDEGFDPRSDLASAGVGARTEIGQDVYFDLEAARTLTRITSSRNSDEDTWRLLMRATVQF